MQAEYTDSQKSHFCGLERIQRRSSVPSQAGVQPDIRDQDGPNSSDCLKQLTVQASQDPNHARFLVPDHSANKKGRSRAPFNAVALLMQQSNEPITKIFIKLLMRTGCTYIHWSRFPKFPFLAMRRKFLFTAPRKPQF